MKTGELCVCMRSVGGGSSVSRKPRLFLIFCCFFSVALGAMSSLFLYYPDGSVTVVPPVFHPNQRYRGVPDGGPGMVLNKESGNGRHKLFFEANEEEYEASSSSNTGKIRHQVHHVEDAVLTPVEEPGAVYADREEELDVTIGMEDLVQTSIVTNVVHNRLIHLDLKGAPPKISFIKELLKLAKLSGINGVLIEWEDTFPWRNMLENITLTRGGYSVTEVEEIITHAEKNLNMEVIPLIQTFGHAEFILKSEEFRHLREVDEDPQSFCPTKPGTMDVIREMVDQVLQFHKNSKYVHIGCDEVYNLHLCPLCTSAFESKDDVFLNHVTRVAKLIREYNKIPIIWDDMLRSVSITRMNRSGIGTLVEPMVWVYAEDVDRFVGWDTWEKYSKVFPTIWAAAAFKGAFGETLVVPPVNRHVDNSQRWVEVLARESVRWEKGVGGLVLTGWQRYDHFAVLCELLPAAIPSLVYTSLVVSTPKEGESVRNRVFVLRNSTSVPSTMEPSKLSSTTATATPEQRVLEPTSESVASSSTEVAGDKILLRRERSPKRKIPHPRSLMRKGEGSLARFGSNGARGSHARLDIGDKNQVISKRFHEILRCSSRMENLQSVMRVDGDTELSFAARCNFPGVAFFRTLFRLRSLLTEIWELEAKVLRGRGWTTAYNVRHNYSLPSRIDEVIFSSVPRLRRILSMTAKSTAISLKTVFSGEVVLEWIEQNIWEAWQVLDSFERIGDRLKRVGVWPRRPLRSPPEMIENLGLRAANLFDHEEL